MVWCIDVSVAGRTGTFARQKYIQMLVVGLILTSTFSVKGIISYIAEETYPEGFSEMSFAQIPYVLVSRYPRCCKEYLPTHI